MQKAMNVMEKAWSIRYCFWL